MEKNPIRPKVRWALSGSIQTRINLWAFRPACAMTKFPGLGEVAATELARSLFTRPAPRLKSSLARRRLMKGEPTAPIRRDRSLSQVESIHVFHQESYLNRSIRHRFTTKRKIWLTTRRPGKLAIVHGAGQEIMVSEVGGWLPKTARGACEGLRSWRDGFRPARPAPRRPPRRDG